MPVLPGNYAYSYGNTGSELADRDVFDISEDVYLEGNRALKINNIGAPYNEQYILTPLLNKGMTAGTYTFSVNVKNHPREKLGSTFRFTGGKAYIKDYQENSRNYFDIKWIYDTTAGFTITEVENEGETWYKYTCELVVEEPLTGFNFNAYEASGEFYYDDLSLTLNGDETGKNYIVDGGFEHVLTSDFSADKLLRTTNVLDELPVTVEATVKISKLRELNSGTIIGDYWTFDVDSFKLEITDFGHPRLLVTDNNKTEYDMTFDEVDASTGEYVHLTVTVDKANSKAYCYVNGELKQTLSGISYPDSVKFNYYAGVGGDLARANKNYFKGQIKDVKVYSDLRTAEEIASDASGNVDTDNLIGGWDLSSKAEAVEDLSENNNDLYTMNSGQWIKEDFPLDDYAYSFAVVGDTQNLNYFNPDNFPILYDWIIDNAEKLNMKYVFGLGDVTDKDLDREWTLAKEQISRMNDVVPYSVIRGNHDSAAQFTRYFTYDEFGSQTDGSYDGTMLNTYKKIQVGNVKYLMLNLDFGPSDAVLNWANEVVENNPDYNVIVTTHGYLYRDGKVIDTSVGGLTQYGGYNDGDDIWDKLIKKHENIVLVLCGHEDADRVLTVKTEGENGNVVTQMLIDPQTIDGYYSEATGAGIVAMLYFSEDGKDVQLRYYSTIKEAYFMVDNQYSLTLDVVEEPEIIVNNDTMPYSITLKGAKRGSFMAALYNSAGALVECQVYDEEDYGETGSIDNIKFEKTAENSTVKFMWWDLSTLSPIATSKPLD